jgi:hypothetical protein
MLALMAKMASHVQDGQLAMYYADADAHFLLTSRVHYMRACRDLYHDLSYVDLI